MRILYVIIKYLTFPGAFIKGFWEHMTCHLLNLPVENSGYLRADEMCGHVEHPLIKKPGALFLFCTAPGFMNFVTGLPIFIVGLINLRIMGIAPGDSVILFAIYVAMIYIGISLMSNVFPHIEDALNLWDAFYVSNKAPAISRILAFPFALTAYCGAYIEKFGIPTVILAAATALVFII